MKCIVCKKLIVAKDIDTYVPLEDSAGVRKPMCRPCFNEAYATKPPPLPAPRAPSPMEKP